MKKKNRPPDSLSLHLRLQVFGAEKTALGPGKIELLMLLAETGSIREAAVKMKMSYMKAWSLIQTMKPLVITTRGGQQRGGAELTQVGREVLMLYQTMARDARSACEPAWKKMQLLLGK
jgi:molybdate transport system regulatory protein